MLESSVPPGHADLLRRLYAAFNARDVETVLAAIHPDVDWPNALEGTRLRGRAAVRDYWARQFATFDPRVEPCAFALAPDGRMVADVHQVVRDRAGTVLVDQRVQHVYRITDGLIAHMEIREP